MQSTSSSLKRGFAGAAAAIGAGVGLNTLVEGIRSSVTASSNLAESMSKNQAVFRESAGVVEQWSTSTARSFGVSQQSALETASTFGALFGPLGIVGRDAADQSRKLTELGADLASFYNSDVASALDAIRSGIVGESEPLRRYGVLLSETRVAGEALAETHKKTTTQLTAQDKALARIQLIFRDTAVAQGDFARTSGGLAGQQKTLAAQVDDLKTKIGDQLRPEIVKALQATNAWLGEPGNREQVIDGTADAVDGLAASYRGLAAAIQGVKDVQGNRSDLKDMLGPFGFLLGGPKETFNRFRSDMENFVELFGLSSKYPAKPPKRPGGLLGSRFADAATRAGGQPAAFSSMADAASRAIAAAVQADVVPATKPPPGPTPKGISVAQRNAWFDSMIGRQLGRVQDITSLKGQVARLGQIAQLIRSRYAVTKDVTRRLTLEDQLLDVLRQQRATKAQRSDLIKQLALGARDEKLGWINFAIERAEASKALKDDRTALRAKEKFLEGLVRHDKKNLELVSELWRTQQKIRDLNKKNSFDPLAGLMQVSSKRLANMLSAGTGLDTAGRRRLGANIAGAEIRPLYINNAIHLDGREVARSTNQHNARTGHRTARQTSGFRG